MPERTALDRDLKVIHEDILQMSALVSKAIERNFTVFQHPDPEAFGAYVARDEEINQLQRQIDDKVIVTIVRHQPAARDLRLLATDLWLSTELERMGDHAKSFVEIIQRAGIEQQTPPYVPPELVDMVAKARQMLDVAAKAYLARDAAVARQIAQEDDTLDALQRRMFEIVTHGMRAGDVTIEWGTYLLWATHNAERIGDRATNICERIIYAVTGEQDELNE